jgi:type I restriction enzyme M protein
VGKVPDPKSQVEQITIAMIYKFMDDMDNQTEELGGKATFFADEFKQYAWSRLLDSKLGGHERLILYAEGIEKMNINENIPQLFRDIFKGAFLPYRDPETLNLFLKEINGFAYDHSERLGDAFEYLLSVLSSQGDAGQFRTPRHIIDFIVETVNPAKEDSVLDPACGTAGFLISSYKHILRQNTKDRLGDLLTADDKGRLMTNFCGYDISPDMVRLSLVNMYLHSFADPSIYEYDTLTSEDRWDERYDVILANPPFMSPKGGIRPHSRFTIKAKRSEVLFVDYIAEHLNVHGRAGVIVPEGIIFQSQNAYKNLRRMLIDEGYLYAVISMPAGVFQPYSGVKTSILLMDKTLAKKAGEILFVKVSNDGFDLGAQRMPIDKNDLPQALKIVKAWKESIAKGNSFDIDETDKAIAHIVSKEKIAESGDYNLSGDRYKEIISYANVKWPMVELGEVCEIKKGSAITKKQIEDGEIPVIAGGQKPAYFHNEFNREGKTITISASGAYAGFVNYFEKPIFASDCSTIQSLDENNLMTKFVYLLLHGKQDEIYKFQIGMGQPHVYPKDLKKFRIPLPPLEVQEKIVAELDGYQKIIDGAKQIVENYKPAIKIDPDWPMVKLGQVCEINPKKSKLKGLDDDLDVSFIPMSDMNQGETNLNITQTRKLRNVLTGYTYFKNSDVLLAKITPCFENGKSGIAKGLRNGIGFGSTEFIAMRPDLNQVLPEIIYCFVSDSTFLTKGASNMTGSAGQQRLSLDFVRMYPISLPPLQTQKKIVAEIESERELVEANKNLIEIFEKKIKDKIGEVWGE